VGKVLAAADFSCKVAKRWDIVCGFAHRGVRDAKLTAVVGRTAFLTISNTWPTGHARFSHRQKRQAFAILRGVQTQPNSRGKPIAENYLRMIQALFHGQTIPWLSHAMHPRASCGDLVCASTRPGFSSHGLARLVLTHNRLEPTSAARPISTPGTF
jgi:hypothetical protein